MLIYGLVCVLIVAFAAIGTMIAAYVVPEMALFGLLLGGTLGTLIALNDATIVGCLLGMLAGLACAPLIFFAVDFETAYMVVFAYSLIGAVFGQPISEWMGGGEEIALLERADIAGGDDAGGEGG